jgi:hypothetical protein
MANVPAVVIKTPSAGQRVKTLSTAKVSRGADSDQAMEDVVDHVAAEEAAAAVDFVNRFKSRTTCSPCRRIPISERPLLQLLEGIRLVNNLVDDM